MVDEDSPVFSAISFRLVLLFLEYLEDHSVMLVKLGYLHVLGHVFRLKLQMY